jgi:hypothetical protein
MKPGIKKTMRVATTFTGAAACAVAFNPAAMAGTAGPAAAAQPGIAANHRISGSIREAQCGAGTSQWMEIKGPYNSVTCFGHRGILSLSPWPNMRAFCGGNNSGYIYGHDNLHSYTVYDHYGHGTYFWHLPSNVKWFYVSEVINIGWSGPDKCP